MNGRIATHKIYRRTINIFGKIHKFHDLQIKSWGTHACTANCNKMSYLLITNDSFDTVLYGVDRQRTGGLIEQCDTLFKRRKRFQVLSLRIKFPVVYFTAVIRNDRIAIIDSAVMI